MLIMMIRTVILYVLVVISLRIMGKRQIGEMQPSELVAAIMISDLASVPMQTVDIPLLCGIVPVLTLLVCEVFMSFACLKSPKARKYITGEPSVVICRGHVNEGELGRLRFNLNDLTEQLRIAGCPDISEVQSAVLETNGQLSVITKSDGIGDIPYLLIADGEINESELVRSGKTRVWLEKKLGDLSAEDVFFATLMPGGRFYMQKKGEEDEI